MNTLVILVLYLLIFVLILNGQGLCTYTNYLLTCPERPELEARSKDPSVYIFCC